MCVCVFCHQMLWLANRNARVLSRLREVLCFCLSLPLYWAVRTDMHTEQTDAYRTCTVSPYPTWCSGMRDLARTK